LTADTKPVGKLPTLWSQVTFICIGYVLTEFSQICKVHRSAATESSIWEVAVWFDEVEPPRDFTQRAPSEALPFGVTVMANVTSSSPTQPTIIWGH